MTDQPTPPNTSTDPSVRTEPMPADGHALPAEDWAQVVAEAERIHAERASEAGGGAGAGAPMGLTPIYLDYPNDYGKTTSTVRPAQLYVIHTGETPLRVGYAQSLTNWAAKAGDPQVSWHRFIDPATVCRWVSLKKRAWHATKANPLSLGYEQSGYAAYTRDVWLGPDGRRQIDLLAQQIVKDGIPVSGIRILTQAQVDAILSGRDTTTVGICTHAQINPESRTDPGKGYPLDVLVDWAAYYHPAHPSTTPPLEDEMTPQQEAKLDYVQKQARAIAELIIEMNKREAARDAANFAAITALIEAQGGGASADEIKAAISEAVQRIDLGQYEIALKKVQEMTQ